LRVRELANEECVAGMRAGFVGVVVALRSGDGLSRLVLCACARRTA
jgi:hypothetical protein